jgi:hypothetical protein
MVPMGSLFALPNKDYGVEALVFGFTVVLLTLPLAAVIAASLFDGLMRRRAGPDRLAPAPLALRRRIAAAADQG